MMRTWKIHAFFTALCMAALLFAVGLAEELPEELPEGSDGFDVATIFLSGAPSLSGEGDMVQLDYALYENLDSMRTIPLDVAALLPLQLEGEKIRVYGYEDEADAGMEFIPQAENPCVFTVEDNRILTQIRIFIGDRNIWTGKFSAEPPQNQPKSIQFALALPADTPQPVTDAPKENAAATPSSAPTLPQAAAPLATPTELAAQEPTATVSPAAEAPTSSPTVTPPPALVKLDLQLEETYAERTEGKISFAGTVRVSLRTIPGLILYVNGAPCDAQYLEWKKAEEQVGNDAQTYAATIEVAVENAAEALAAEETLNFTVKNLPVGEDIREASVSVGLVENAQYVLDTSDVQTLEKKLSIRDRVVLSLLPLELKADAMTYSGKTQEIRIVPALGVAEGYFDEFDLARPDQALKGMEAWERYLAASFSVVPEDKAAVQAADGAIAAQGTDAGAYTILYAPAAEAMQALEQALGQRYADYAFHIGIAQDFPGEDGIAVQRCVWRIQPKEITMSVEDEATLSYTGAEQAVTFRLTLDGEGFFERDAYYNGDLQLVVHGTDAGVYALQDGEIVTAEGKEHLTGNYRIMIHGNFEIKPADLTSKDVTLALRPEQGKYQDGAPVTPQLLLDTGTGTPTELLENRDYALVCLNENGVEVPQMVDAGQYRLKISGCNNYTGSVELHYTVAPKTLQATLDILDGKAVAISNGLELDHVACDEEGNWRYFPDDENVVVILELRTDKSEAWVRLDGWPYDGRSTDDAGHMPASGWGGEEAKAYRYYLQGDDAPLEQAPCDAGSYTVEAVWQNGKEEKTARTDFEITPREISVVPETQSKVYGEEDPELTATMERLAPDGFAPVYEVTRQAGEDAGEYTIAASGKERQGNYQVLYGEAVFTIEPRPIDDAAVTVEQTGLRSNGLPDLKVMYQEDRLTEGTDYVTNQKENGETITLRGIGNFAGEREVTVVRRSIGVDLTDESGNALQALRLDSKGNAYVHAVLEAEDGGELEEDMLLEIWINGALYDGVVREGDGFSFTVSGLEQEDEVALRVSVDGQDIFDGSMAIERFPYRALFLGLAIGLGLAAAACLLVSVKLSKRIRKEQMKIVDETSHQSNRTIRKWDV